MPCKAVTLVVSLRMMATLDKKFAFEYVEKNENVLLEQVKALKFDLPETTRVTEEKKL